MGEQTKIAWADHTFNPWEGCVKISPACDSCYAAARDERLHHGDNWGKDADRLMHKDAYWRQPFKWNRDAIAAGKKRRNVFCGSLMDIMEDRRDLDAARRRVYDLVMMTPYLNWLFVTKRPMNFRRLLPMAWLDEMPHNVWGITTVESVEYTWRIDELLEIPFRVHGVSYEPALGPVDFRPWLERGLHWLIIGGESKQRGHVARDFLLEWAHDGIAACRETGRAALVKQVGSSPVMGPEDFINIRHPKGEDMEEWPLSLQVQEFPKEGCLEM